MNIIQSYLFNQTETQQNQEYKRIDERERETERGIVLYFLLVHHHQQQKKY